MKMQKLCLTKLISRFCKLSGSWAIVIYIPSDMSLKQIKELIPFIDADDDAQSIVDGMLFVLFDSEEECHSVFRLFEDKGPLYAYTTNCDGILDNENA